MKNLGGNLYELEEEECLRDHWIPQVVIKGPDTVRNSEFEDKGVTYQKFQGSRMPVVVGVRAETPEKAVTHCGQERR